MDSVKPTVTPNSRRDGEKHSHPAFGMIGMVTRTGQATLFGSDIGHNQTVCIKVKTATLNRSLSSDWFHGDKTVVELEMSHAQFARFITNNGHGDGVPCTLTFREGAGHIPGIDRIETKYETARREIQQSARDDAAAALTSLRKIQEMLDEGRMSKKEIKSALDAAVCCIGNLPANLGFTVERAERALEKATSDAKIEVESYVAMTAQRLGLKQISDLGLLENKDGK